MARLWRSIRDRKSTRLNSSHLGISYAGFCLKIKLLSATSLTLLLVRALRVPVTRSLLGRPSAAIPTISDSLYLVHQFNLILFYKHAAPLVSPTFPPAVLIPV